MPDSLKPPVTLTPEDDTLSSGLRRHPTHIYIHIHMNNMNKKCMKHLQDMFKKSSYITKVHS